MRQGELMQAIKNNEGKTLQKVKGGHPGNASVKGGIYGRRRSGGTNDFTAEGSNRK